jgi:hypothetical protein
VQTDALLSLIALLWYKMTPRFVDKLVSIISAVILQNGRNMIMQINLFRNRHAPVVVASQDMFVNIGSDDL